MNKHTHIYNTYKIEFHEPDTFFSIGPDSLVRSDEGHICFSPVFLWSSQLLQQCRDVASAAMCSVGTPISYPCNFII